MVKHFGLVVVIIGAIQYVGAGSAQAGDPIEQTLKGLSGLVRKMHEQAPAPPTGNLGAPAAASNAQTTGGSSAEAGARTIDDSSITYIMEDCSKSISYRAIRMTVPSTIDLADDATARALLARGAKWAEAKCHKGNWGNIVVSIGQNPKNPSNIAVRGRNYDDKTLTWRELYNGPREARQKAEAEQRANRERAERAAAQMREQQARAAAEQAAKARIAERWSTFSSKNGVTKLVTNQELFKNPFMFEKQAVAIVVTFVQMQAADQGLFKFDGDPVVVSDVPKTRFGSHAGAILLAGDVLGTTKVQIPGLGEVAVPHLSYIGAEDCGESGCGDIVPKR